MNAKETLLKQALDALFAKSKNPPTITVTTDEKGAQVASVAASPEVMKTIPYKLQSLSLSPYLIHQIIGELPTVQGDNQSVRYTYTIELF